MKKYYVQTNVNMQAKNNAWRQLQAFAYEQNGTLILGEDVMEEFIKRVLTKIDQVNKENPRCQDISFNKLNNSNLSVYATVHPDHVFSLTFLPIKRELN